MCEKSLADKLLEATTFLQDEAFDRTCELEDQHAVLAADCYYHPDYMKAYERLYESKRETSKAEKVSRMTPRRIVSCS